MTCMHAVTAAAGSGLVFREWRATRPRGRRQTCSATPRTAVPTLACGYPDFNPRGTGRRARAYRHPRSVLVLSGSYSVLTDCAVYGTGG